MAYTATLATRGRSKKLHWVAAPGHSFRSDPVGTTIAGRSLCEHAWHDDWAVAEYPDHGEAQMDELERLFCRRCDR
jgi:hypothetical protein